LEAIIGNSKLLLCKGDITVQNTEAIVNAANSGLLGGGGVDGAIHRAGGPEILEECKMIRAARGICPSGQAVITMGGLLRAKFVIHAVGPIWEGGYKGEDDLLKNAYVNCLELALKNNIKTISFPSISTGAYRFPVDRAAVIALGAVCDFLRENRSVVNHPIGNHPIEEVRFVLFSDNILTKYEEAWEKVRSGCSV
jgi:O-acetyl-ADP-ribose deacetylase (regulator of RNase III)